MNRLKELRLKHGYKTQKDLADNLFVNQTAVSQWERGVTVPSSQMLFKLSELYGESIDYILGIDDKANDPSSRDTQSKQNSSSQKETIQAAFWGGEKDLSQEDLDAMWNDVSRFAAFLVNQKKQEKGKND